MCLYLHKRLIFSGGIDSIVLVEGWRAKLVGPLRSPSRMHPNYHRPPRKKHPINLLFFLFRFSRVHFYIPHLFYRTVAAALTELDQQFIWTLLLVRSPPTILSYMLLLLPKIKIKILVVLILLSITWLLLLISNFSLSFSTAKFLPFNAVRNMNKGFNSLI